MFRGAGARAHATAVAASATTSTPASAATPKVPVILSSQSVTFPATSPRASAPAAVSTSVDLTSVDAVVAQTQQENVSILARHAGTSASDRRAQKFTVLREGLTAAFAPLLPERPRKCSRDTPDGPSEELLAYCLHNERVDFARSQVNGQLGISESNSSNKVFGNLLPKVRCFQVPRQPPREACGDRHPCRE